MRSLRSEMLTVLIVLAVPAGVALIFPYEVLRFKPVASCERKVLGAALVRLTPTEEEAAVKAAKTTWRLDEGGVRRLRVAMLFGELPEPPHVSVLNVEDRRHSVEWPLVGRGDVPFLPSLKAGPPARIVPDGAAADMRTFSRNELLKID